MSENAEVRYEFTEYAITSPFGARNWVEVSRDELLVRFDFLGFFVESGMQWLECILDESEDYDSTVFVVRVKGYER